MALEVFTNEEDGIEAQIHVHPSHGFSITFHDIDAGEQLEVIKFRRTIGEARIVAKSFVDGIPEHKITIAA